MNNKNEILRSLPKVDECLLILLPFINEQNIPAAVAKKAVQAEIDSVRKKILSDDAVEIPESLDEWTSYFQSAIERIQTPHFRRVINGTGIVVHTNLGRSLLSSEAVEQLISAASHYTNLEFDLTTGKRGSRYSLVENLICEMTGAEAALVVNNNAAAVMLALDSLASNKEVIVSRGQLVEIGGSFRIPDVMAKSGAHLVEVGATNRTHLYDYENGLTEDTALLLRVHSSNFRMIGFTSEVSAEELVALGRKHNLAVMEDLGSGSLVDMSRYGLPKETTVQEVVKAGADIITFSGDKLLGGPQAGIIVGRSEYISLLKKNPLNRALRIDKFTLAALEATLRSYYSLEQAEHQLPTLRMISESSDSVRKRARRVLRAIKTEVEPWCACQLVPIQSKVGGGALPEYTLSSWAIEMKPKDRNITDVEKDFRAIEVPIIGRIIDDCYIIDFRTIQDGEVVELSNILKRYFTGS